MEDNSSGIFSGSLAETLNSEEAEFSDSFDGALDDDTAEESGPLDFNDRWTSEELSTKLLEIAQEQALQARPEQACREEPSIKAGTKASNDEFMPKWNEAGADLNLPVKSEDAMPSHLRPKISTKMYVLGKQLMPKWGRSDSSKEKPSSLPKNKVRSYLRPTASTRIHAVENQKSPISITSTSSKGADSSRRLTRASSTKERYCPSSGDLSRLKSPLSKESPSVPRPTGQVQVNSVSSQDSKDKIRLRRSKSQDTRSLSGDSSRMQSPSSVQGDKDKDKHRGKDGGGGGGEGGGGGGDGEDVKHLKVVREQNIFVIHQARNDKIRELEGKPRVVRRKRYSLGVFIAHVHTTQLTST